MAILNTENTDAPDSPPAPNPPNRPAFFLRTVIPKSSITCSLSLSLFPPHAHSRQLRPWLSSARQLVTAHSTFLSVHSICDSTLSLRPICEIPLFVPVVALASLPSHNPSRDILLTLTTSAKVAFFRYDDQESNLVLAGDVALPHPSPHLLATHPTKPLVAVATLSRSLTIFPLLFLPKSIAAGKLTTVPLAGTPLSITFLHDQGESEAILIVLLQQVHNQMLALFTITPTPDGLAVSRTANMIPCVNRPDDIAVARAASKLSGEPQKYTPSAIAVTRLANCPYMFAVFVPGKVAAGDARTVLKGIENGDPAPMSVCLDNEEHGQNLTSHLLGYSNVSPSTSGQMQPLRSADSLTPTQTPDRGVSEAPVFSMALRRSIRLMNEVGGGVRREREGGEEHLLYLSVPAYVTLETGEGMIPITAWTDARDHFLEENDDTNGLYFVTESGAMFVLRWSESVQEGTATFRIPGDERLVESKKHFYVSFVGDVGPAVSIAALDHRLIYIANDGVDGSLRKLHLPKVDLQGLHPKVMSGLRGRGVIGPEQRRFGLEVRQEFLNLSPISDFVIVPSAKKQMRREKRSRGAVGDEENRQSLGRFEERDNGHSESRLGKTESSPHTNMRVDEKVEEKGLQLGTSRDFKTLVRETPDSEEDVSASSHVLHGSSRESEIIVCSGFGRHGSIRLIRPGGPVNIFASSAHTFAACNDMFPIHFTKDSVFHAGISLSFAQSSGILYSVTVDPEEQMEAEDSASVVAKLIDGTEATGIRSDLRTIAIGALEDGVLAQVHENGVRVILLKKMNKLPRERIIANGILKESLYEHIVDWTPPEGGFISVGTVGCGFALVCVIRNGQECPLLCLLKLYPNEFSKGLCMVSSTPLEQELSCVSIPEWAAVRSDLDFAPSPFLPVAVLGTYLPSIQVRLLGPTMEVLDQRVTSPWGRHLKRDHGPPTEMNSSHSSRWQQNVDVSEDSLTTYLSTAVPESLCAVSFGGKRLIFAGLRDGSAVCFSFEDADVDEKMDPGSIAGAHLTIESHKKLGNRPVVLKSAVVAVGLVVIGQAERPWMCMSMGGTRMQWIPLSFTETSALCAYSILGAERCIAVVGEDGALHICGIRRRSEVSVKSIHVGATPRRVLAVSYPDDSIVVATSQERRSEAGNYGRGDSAFLGPWASQVGFRALGGDSPTGQIVNSELRVYNRKLRVQTGSKFLLAGEQVHVLLSWLGYVVVGTSSDICVVQASASQKICKRGRLRLLSLLSKGGASASLAPTARTKFLVCSEVVLPGAVLSGAAHPSAGVLIVSCNEEVIVFGVLKSRRILLEITRVALRALVVSISIYDDLICVADRKDSITLFNFAGGKLIRDRSDHRRRTISDSVLVDRTMAVAVDRRGGFFSVGYEEGDAPTPPLGNCADIIGVHDLLGTYESLATVRQAVNAALATHGAGERSLDGFGEEFDVINPEGSAENTAESSDYAQEGEATTDATGSAGHGSSGSDHVMIATSAESQDENPSGNSTSFGDTEGAEANTMNPTQTTGGNLTEVVGQPNIPGITNALANILNQTVATGGSGSNWNDTTAIARNLVCHHSFNLSETCLRVRHGSFNRCEKAQELEERKQVCESQPLKCRDEFFREASSGVFCGTLGGALVAAVPMHVRTFGLLGRVEAEMSVHPSIAGPALGSCHKTFRAIYGKRAEGVIDGDLLKHFSMLNRSSKMEICWRVGYPGEEGMLYIEALIQDLTDRVG